MKLLGSRSTSESKSTDIKENHGGNSTAKITHLKQVRERILYIGQLYGSNKKVSTSDSRTNVIYCTNLYHIHVPGRSFGHFKKFNLILTKFEHDKCMIFCVIYIEKLTSVGMQFPT